MFRKGIIEMNRMTLTELQQKIKEIDGVTIGDSKISDRYFMKFIEEAGELSECIRKDKRMVDDNIKGTIEEELYDEDDSFEDFHKVNEFLKTIVK